MAGSEIDLLVQVGTVAKDYTLIVEAKRNGEPRFVRDAVHFLRSKAERYGPDAFPVLVAPYLSAASQKLCRELGVSFADLCGNCRIAFDTIHIERIGHENVWADKRPLKSLFAMKASRAMRCMLHEPRRRWQLQYLAAQAEISLALASKLKHKLLDLEYAREDEEGFFITQPELVLKDWCKIYSIQKNVQVEYFARASQPELEHLIAATCRDYEVKYCLTAFSAAQRVAPHVRGVTHGYAYVDSEPGEIAKQLGWQEVGYKGNFRLIKAPDQSTFWNTQEVDGLLLASDIQTYLDLASLSGRGNEAAEILLERRLRPAW